MSQVAYDVVVCNDVSTLVMGQNYILGRPRRITKDKDGVEIRMAPMSRQGG